MRLFIDTEFTNLVDAELISLALVDVTGAHEIYMERKLIPAGCSDFVRKAVLPVLDGNERSLSDPEFAVMLRRFLDQIPDPIVTCDCPTDLKLLAHVLAGLDTPSGTNGPAPRYSTALMTEVGEFRPEVERFFRCTAGAIRHHALWDARANAYAYEQCARRIAGTSGPTQ